MTLRTFTNALKDLSRGSGLSRTCITSTELILKCKGAPGYGNLQRHGDIDYPDSSLEETYGTLEQLRKEGKFKYIGVSECSAETLHKITEVKLTEMSTNAKKDDIDVGHS